MIYNDNLSQNLSSQPVVNDIGLSSQLILSQSSTDIQHGQYNVTLMTRLFQTGLGDTKCGFLSHSLRIAARKVLYKGQ